LRKTTIDMSGPEVYNGAPGVQRLRERRITKAEAEDTFRNPDITHPDDKGNPCYVKRFPRGRRVAPVIRAGSNPAFGITVMD
jgi:hypothetical protein